MTPLVSGRQEFQTVLRENPMPVNAGVPNRGAGTRRETTLTRCGMVWTESSERPRPPSETECVRAGPDEAGVIPCQRGREPIRAQPVAATHKQKRRGLTESRSKVKEREGGSGFNSHLEGRTESGHQPTGGNAVAPVPGTPTFGDSGCSDWSTSGGGSHFRWLIARPPPFFQPTSIRPQNISWSKKF